MSRYDAAVRECRVQLGDAIFMKIAYFAVANVEIPMGFYQAAERALRGDVVSRACRVYDRGSNSAAIWYLKRTNEKAFAQAAKAARVDVADLERLSDRLRHIRDKVHSHLDKKMVENSSAVWSEAGLTWNEIDRLLYGGLTLLANLDASNAGGPLKPVTYDGSDIRGMFPPIGENPGD